MVKNNFKKTISWLLILCMITAVLMQAGCGNEIPAESTPDVTLNSTPKESSSEQPDESTPIESTPSESTPDIAEVYSITYDLDGGIGADENPDKYTSLDGDITLFVPVKSGYAFAGWTGTGVDIPTEKVVIPTGSTGDRAYTATWTTVDEKYDDIGETEDPLKDEISKLQNSNDGIQVNPNGITALSTPDLVNYRGGLYYIKTAYTTVKVDGVMDNAYTYGLHYELDLPEKKDAYVDCDTTYDVYMTVTQDGMMHVFVKVIDRDIVINDEQWAAHWWHCDVWQMYVDFGNDKSSNEKLWSFAAEPTKKYLQDNPENWIVIMTDDGFNIEFEFDNNGKPFKYGDELGFSFFYNDTWEYKSPSNYKRSNTRTSSVKVPAEGNYAGPSAPTQDGLFVTSYPLDHKGDINSDSEATLTGNMINDVVSGAAGVAVVYGANSSAHTEINAENLAKILFEMNINAYPTREDVLNLKHGEYVIYINSVGDSDCSSMISELHYAEYGVKVLGGKIVSVGWQAKANNGIIEIITAVFHYAVNGGDASLIGTYTDELEGVPGANVPKMEGIDWITDAGDDAYVLLDRRTSSSAYDNYRNLLDEAGYTLYVENNVASVKSATYYNEDTVINMVFGTSSNDRNLRVTVEPISNTALPMLEAEEYESKTQSSVTLLNPNNLTMIVKLANGEFIVIDSGNRNTDNYIYEELMKQHKSNSKIVIAAWIFTHFHQDHIGGFIDFTLNNNYMKKVRIKSVIYNFPEKQVLDTASSSDQINLDLWPTCIQRCRDQGATIYQARTGQKYYFANATVELLHTYDDLMPFFVRGDNTNHTNIMFCIDIEGQRIMVTGDLTNPGFLVAAHRYGSYLKSDILQVAHHGYGDGSSDTTFYALVNAPVVLVPGTGVNAAQKWAADNAKEVYYRSDGTKTLTLPHKVTEGTK